MNDSTTFEVIPVATLLERVRRLHEERCRLVQIGATVLPSELQINYSFDRAGQLLNLRLLLPAEKPRVPSISEIYWCAFIYENEMHDLFKVQVKGMVIDFEGKFYQTAVKYPFGSTRAPATKTAPAAAARPAPAPAPASTPAAVATLAE